MCIHSHGFMCRRLYSLPLTIAPLSAAGENLSLKPVGVYEYRSGVVRGIREIGFMVSSSLVVDDVRSVHRIQSCSQVEV